ncbi:SH3 domain-containing protein [Cytobacillus sp. IB215665]|uniref:SH3 domain-containing protein n=1 Tax=Cytobacillus sp. IB215665 TaxID=3097357 RepID=UPI002A101F5B|nr:SH3 domain-containing protein [Cytobacillus sp. IB215665]MDX8364091.1 SH3 domain-containing protein [Cytobacillus sp. IB215665]
MFKKICLFVLILVILIPNNKITYAVTDTIAVNVTTLNVRTGPGLSYEVITNIKQDEQFTLIATKDDWIQIQLPNQQTGWVASWLVTQNLITEKYSSPSKVTANVDELRIRQGPGSNFQIIGSMNQGDYANVIEQQGDWTKISFASQVGWVSSQYLSPSESNLTTPIEQEKIIAQISVDSLNVRSEPSLESEIIGQLHNGEENAIISVKENWLEISYMNTSGWIHQSFVNIINEQQQELDSLNPNEDTDGSESEQEEQQHTNIKGVVTATTLNVRSDYSLDGNIVGNIPQGEEILILEENNKWYKINWLGGEGWVASWYVKLFEEQDNPNPVNEPTEEENTVRILHNGTNLRDKPSTTANIVVRANEGDTYPILDVDGDWYKIQLPNESTAYVAGWIVKASTNVPIIEKNGIEQYLKDKIIVIDPGHGGRDGGTTGLKGSLEKNITVRTANILEDKLSAAGATVFLTREEDIYVSLRNRVSISHYYNADAFISLHYDSTTDRGVSGITSFYYDETKDKQLAVSLHEQLINYTNLNDRSARFGNYHVLRENKQPSALLELGFLSNNEEELMINSTHFQEAIGNALYYGLAQYFNKN